MYIIEKNNKITGGRPVIFIQEMLRQRRRKMITHEWTVTHRGESITAVLHLVGEDCTVTVAGGELSHVGAVSVCPKTGEVQTIVFPGHKEQYITEPWCRHIHEITGGAVSVTAGVHYDGLTKQEIAGVMDAVSGLEEQMLRYLAGEREEMI